MEYMDSQIQLFYERFDGLLNTAYDAGGKAFRNGFSFENNPFLKDHVEISKEWSQGWKDSSEVKTDE